MGPVVLRGIYRESKTETVAWKATSGSILAINE